MNWNRWYQTWSYIRSSLWIVPVVAMVIQQVAIRVLDRLDPLIGWTFYGATAAGAPRVLDAITTMILSFLVFTFGSLLVAVQVASGQLTPRIIVAALLRNDVVRYTVGLFVFTLLMAIGMSSRIDAGVNQLAFGVTIVAALGSIVAFLYLIDYAARLLRPVSIMAIVGEQGLKVIEAVYPRGAAKQKPGAPEPLPARPRQIVHHRGTSGIVLAVNLDQLMAVARAADCTVEFMSHVGDFVGVDEPLFQIYGGDVADEQKLLSAVAFGPERTMEQDPLFALRILVDIGIKALSKAINDPTTAVLAIDQLHRLLRMVGRRHTHNERIEDEAGALRVVWRTPDWEDFVHLALAEIRFYGAENAQIARRLRAMLSNLIQTLPERRHAALLLELDLLDRTIDKLYVFPEDAEIARVADAQGLGGSGTIKSQAA